MYAVKRGLGSFLEWLAGVYAKPAGASVNYVVSAPTPGTVIYPAGPGYSALIQGTDGPYYQTVASAPAPTAEQLAGDPDVAVSDLVNAQAEAQNSLNAGLVESSLSDEVLGTAGAGVTAVTNALPWLGLVAAGGVVLYAMSQRRR